MFINKALKVLLAFSLVMISCDSRSELDSSGLRDALNSGDPAAREEAFRDVQAGLLDSRAEKDALQRLEKAGRPRIESEGIVRGAVDFTDGTIRYFATNPLEVMEAATGGAGGESAGGGRGDGGDGDGGGSSAGGGGTGRSGGGESAGDILRIVDWGPRGEVPIENRRPNIYVMFDRPMVPLARLGTPIADVPYFTIEPPVEGSFRWFGTRTLGFRPAKALLDEPRYRISLAAGAAARSGAVLAEDFSFDIFGERVKIVNMYPGSPKTNPEDSVSREWVPAPLAREITLEFNQPVDIARIAPSIRVYDSEESSGEADLSFSVSRPEYPEKLESRTRRALLIRLDEEPPEDTVLTILLDKGAAPFEGYPRTASVQSFQLETIEPFEAEGLNAYAEGFPQDNREAPFPVRLSYSHFLDTSQSTAGFTVSVDGTPVNPVEIALTSYYVIFSLTGLRPGMTVSVETPPGVTDEYGRRAEAGVWDTTVPRPWPLVEFPSSGEGLRHLEAEFEPALMWASRNLVQGRLGRAGRPSYFDSPEFEPPYEEIDFSALPKDVTSFHRENLRALLPPSGFGTVFFDYAFRKDPELQDEPRWQWERDRIAVQVTDLGISVRAARNAVLIWVNRLSDGTAVPEARVKAFNLRGTEYTGTTGADGLAVLPIPSGAFGGQFSNNDRYRTETLYVRAEKNGDLAEMQVTDFNDSWSYGVYRSTSPTDAEEVLDRVHMFTDRGLYRPGEELALRGIHWLQGPGGFTPADTAYRIRITEAPGETVIWEDGGRVSESGGFAHRLTLPEGLEPGGYRIAYSGGGAGAEFEESIGFRIAAFRRVNFQVTSEVRGEHYFRGDTLEASLGASNLAGGPLPGADFSYYWTRRPVAFVPPGPRWKDWRFGTSAWAPEQSLSSGEGNLSGAGTATISESTMNHEVTGEAYRYTLEATVEDIDRQAVSSLASAVVHPADYYLGVRLGKGSTEGWWSRFVAVGDEFTAQVRLVDIFGDEVKLNTPVSMGLIRGEWQSSAVQGLYGRVDTRWEYVKEEIRREETGLRRGASEVSLTIDKPGEYTLFFEYIDSRERRARTELDLYASGSGWVRRSGRTPREINLIVDRDMYEPGETARILVQSPIEKGRYLLTLERGEILEERVIELEGSTEMIEVEVKPEYVPVFYAALSSFTERTETEDDFFEPDLGRPRSLFGLTAVRVDTAPVELDVRVESGKAVYGPGDEVEILVSVEHEGRPVSGAEVTLLGVDRGVLDLIDYRVPDPLKYFYSEGHFPHGVMGDDSRRLLLRPVTYEAAELQGGDGSKEPAAYAMEEGGVGRPRDRRNFNPLAFFEPALITDDEGKLEFRAVLPDTLTAYRITAAALEGVKLGLDEGEFQVSNAVNVRTALPRRFRSRDTAAAGVILDNTSDAAVDVRVSASSDILNIAGEGERSVRLEAGASAELPFILEAVEKGEGVIRFTVQSDMLREVLEEKVVVEQPVVTEVFTSAGVVRGAGPGDAAAAGGGAPGVGEPPGDGAAAGGGPGSAAAAGAAPVETVVLPGYSAESWGGLSLSVAASLGPYIEAPLGRLLNPEYPLIADELYELAAWAVVLGAGSGDTGEPGEREALEERAADVFGRLAAFQFPDGGIGYRAPSLEYARPDWFLSILSAHAAMELEAAGLEAARFGGALNWDDLRGRLRERLAEAKGEDAVSFRAAWSAWVLARSGAVSRDEIAWLGDSGDRLGIAGYGLLSEAHGILGARRKAVSLYQRAKKFITLGTRSVDAAETAEAADYFGSPEIPLALLLRSAVLRGEESELVMRLAGSLDTGRNSRRFSSRFDDLWVVTGFAPLLRNESGGAARRVTVSLGGRTLIQEPPPGAEPPDSGGPLSLRRNFPLSAPPLSELEADTPLDLTFITAAAAAGRAEDSEAAESARRAESAGSARAARAAQRAGTAEAAPLYYAAALSYALPAETALPRDEGIEVFSRIETLSGEEVSSDELPLGETLRVRVNINTLNRRSFLRLVVPIPSGAEIVDPSLAVSGRYLDAGGTNSETWTRETVYGDTVDATGEGGGYFSPAAWSFWFYRPVQKVYDNAASYLWEDFYAGQREISFLIRTTTPGIYPTPPVTASLQFEPEVFGRGPGELMIIRAGE